MRVRRRKHISLHRGPVPVATARNEYWSMDFVHDQLTNGRKFRVLTVIDKWSRESVLLEVDFSLTGQSVVNAMQRLCLSRALPKAITVDQVRNSLRSPWTSGPGTTRLSSTSSGPASPRRMRSSNPSTVGCEMNV